MIYNNVFYFYNINSIGGVESFFYYLAKKYCDKDITIFYTYGDEKQIKRLKNYVRVKKYNNEIIKCKKAFFNYDAVIIDKVEAEEYIQIIHADVKEQRKYGHIPYIYPKITKYVGVSKLVCDNFKEITGKECELIYNPIMIDEPKKLIKLISATRLTNEKGKDLIIRLGNILNRMGINYIWYIFTDDYNVIQNDNIIYMKPRLDISTYIKDADFLVQLSKCEAYCYSVVESLVLGTPVIATDLPVYKEIGLNEDNSILLDLNFNNISKDALLKEYIFKYEPPKTEWKKILVDSISTYWEEKNMKYEVEALNFYEEEQIEDMMLKRIPKAGEKFIVDADRYDVLTGNNDYNAQFVKLVREIKEEVKDETTKKKNSRTKKSNI